jgi:hypothetical protein
MGSLTNFAENKLLDHACGTAYTPPSTVYIALATADPGEAATGASMSEVANSGGYSRLAITFGAAASRKVEQSGALNYTATGSWGTVTHWAIVDSATHGAGNALAYGAFSIAKQVVNGNTPSIPTTEVDVEISTGAFSNYLVHKLLDLMFRNTAFTAPATHYAALTTATVSDSSTGSTITEPSGNGYARKAIAANGGSSPTWSLASGGAVSNAAAASFGTASGSWGTIVATATCDASSGGNALFYDNGVTDQAVGANDPVSFDTGAFSCSLS